MAKKRKKRKRGQSGLFDPGQVLTGRQMRRAARAAARIELRPSLKAYARENQRIARQARREQIGLRRLGNQTARQVGAVNDQMNRALGQGVTVAREAGQGLVAGTAADRAASEKRTAAVQEGVLGGQLASLAGANIDPGGSASQQAMAKAIAGRQGDARNVNDAFAGLARTQAEGMATTAGNQLQAGRMRGAEAERAIRSAIMSRRADARAAASDARREVRGKMADVKALFGPTILNNLMRLRDSERSFVNERAALMQDAQANADRSALGWAKLAEDQRQANMGSGGGAGAGMTRQDWRNWSTAADDLSTQLGGRIRPGQWENFLDRLAKKEGVNWTPVQRRQFKRRYKKRRGYTKKKG